MIEVSLSLADGVDPVSCPDETTLGRWVRHAVGDLRPGGSIDLRIVDEAEMADLNRAWRGKDRPTNVLSFPAEGSPPGVEVQPLGDIALCDAVIRREAADQGKPVAHHWAHLVTHGVLHLLGFDHEDAQDAAEMEALEVARLADLGIPDPYDHGL